jgi:hypothetical protein
MTSRFGLIALAILAPAAVGCAGSPAAPFNAMPQAQITAYRLQNYEPPAQAAATPASPLPAVGIPGVPPEIQAWLNQGAAGLRQLIPPGMQIPGLNLPGLTPTPAPAAAVDQTPRFHGFRILGQTQVFDSDTKDKLAKALGTGDNFEQGQGCMYAEMGISFSPTPGAPPDDILVSFSCRQVASFNFMWPHQGTSMKSKTVEQLAEIVHRIWPS